MTIPARVVAFAAASALCTLARLPSAFAADTDPPTIVHTAVIEAAPGAPLKILADITDESEIFEPKVHYRLVGSRDYLTMSMMRSAGATFSATIPDTAVTGDLEYFIEAYDAQGNGPSRFGSEKAPQRVRVVTAPPPPKVTVVEAVTPKTDWATPATATQESQQPFRPPLYAAGIAVGAGAVAGAIGSYFGTRVLDARVNLDDSRSAATGATTCFAIAGVAGAVAAGLLIWHFVPRGEGKTETAPEFAIGPQSIAVRGTF